MSVDGFLARRDDTFDFLLVGEQVPHGFEEFLASVDVVVMGRRTFEVVLRLGHLATYGKKPMMVLSSRPLDFSSVKGGVVEQISGEPTDIVKRLGRSTDDGDAFYLTHAHTVAPPPIPRPPQRPSARLSDWL